jgi:sulfur-carrier protein
LRLEDDGKSPSSYPFPYPFPLGFPAHHPAIAPPSTASYNSKLYKLVQYVPEIKEMARVRIPTPLRKLTKGLAEVESSAATVKALFVDLDGRYAGIREKVFDEGGQIRRFINVFVNGEDVRNLRGPDTEVKATDEISIVPAIAGGTQKTSETLREKSSEKYPVKMGPKNIR